MATETLDGLTALLQRLDLGGMPQFPSADVLHQPIDIFHVYLADTLQKLVGCDPQQAYEAIQPANNTTNGDLDIVLPRLKLADGPDLQELAADLVKKFPTPHPLFVVPWKDGIHVRFYLSPRVLPRIVLPYILDRGVRYGIFTDPASRLDGPPATTDTPQTSTEKPPTPTDVSLTSTDPPKLIDTPTSTDTPQNAPRETRPGLPQQKKALVEFSSPNLGQDFRTDHLRSTILGSFVANMYDAMGWHVVRINYLGDWGKHIGLLGVGWTRYGSDEVLDDHADPFRHLHDMYARMEEELKPAWEAKKKARDKGDTASDAGGEEDGLFAERDATFKKLEEGDAQAVELWETLRRISISYYDPAYRRLGITFDDYPGESLVCRNPEAIETIDALLKKKDLSEQAEDGSWVVDFAKHDAAKLGTATVRSKDGTSTYFLRDVATVMDRLEDYNFGKMIYVVGEQDVHFRQVFKTVELMGHADVAARLSHLTFTRGPPRWGKERLLGDILDRCEEYSQRAAAEPSLLPQPLRNLSSGALRTLAINSLIVLELNTRNKAHTIGLDVEMLMTSEGETGLSLQLGFSRLSTAIRELEKKQRAAAGEGGKLDGEPDYLLLADNPWIELPRLLVRFPAVTATAYKTLEPGGLMGYVFSVLDEVGYCLDETAEGLDGIDGEGDQAVAKYAARIMLLRCTKQVVLNGMKLLNIVPVR